MVVLYWCNNILTGRIELDEISLGLSEGEGDNKAFNQLGVMVK